MTTRKRVVHRESYQAVDESGTVHTIDVFQEILEVTYLDNSTGRTEGIKTHKMAANGNHVNPESDGTLEDVVTGRKMRRL